VSYATLDDMISRYPNRDLVQLTNDDPTSTVIQDATILQAISDASAEIDGYIGGRFELPLTEPPAILSRLATDIAMYRLQSLRPIHDLADARQRYVDAIAALGKIATGELGLGLAADGSEARVANEDLVTGGPRRLFNRKKLKGF
jgi:phage gp36-like protein